MDKVGRGPGAARNRRRASRVLMAAAVLLAAAPLAAQTAGPRGETVYDATFFATFAPANALQIVQRTPGFTLEQGDSNLRGFGGAAGNVVVNGQRPSAKSDRLETILARIPANRVLRVTVSAGDLFGAEFAGKPQVLNLVLRSDGGLAGTIEAKVRRSFTGELYPAGAVSALLRQGKSTFNLAVKLDNEETSEEGTDRVRSLPAGTLEESRRKINYSRDPAGSASAGWAFDGGTDRTAHVNLKAEFDHYRLHQINAVTPRLGPVRDDRLGFRYNLTSYELGGDVTRPLAGGGIKVVGLITRRQRDNRDSQYVRLDGAVIGGGEQALDARIEETIARVVWARGNLLGWTIETGGERAFNRLRSDVNLFTLDTAGGRTRVDLPIDHAVVQELRSEAFVNAGHKLSSHWRLDLALTYESSHLTVSGDVAAERRLRFLKPRAVLDWSQPRSWHAQLSLQRRVAQLQFEDFISSAELNTNRVNGGNANLVPQRTWELLGFAEHPVLGTGLVRFEAGYNAVQQVQDRVPTPEGFDAPGNLGAGHEIILRSKLDLPLGQLGVKGGRLSLYGSYVASAVRDPYTASTRPFSGNALFFWEATFRQDRGKLAWGFELSGSTPTTFYRRDETDRVWNQMPYVTAFVDYRPTGSTILTLGLENATGVASFRRRSFFRPDRSSPSPVEEEYRQRNRHIVPYLSVKHTF